MPALAQRLSLSMILALSLVFCSRVALAGYTGEIGGTGYPVHDIKADADPSKLTDEERAYIDKIKDAFDDVDTDAEAIARAAQIRQNVCEALKMVKCIDADVGDCLLMLKKKGRICVSFNMKGAHGTAQTDQKTGWTEDDKININAKHVGNGLLSCLSPTFYWLVTTLYHEGTHAGQSYEPTPAELDGLRDEPGNPKSPVNECKLTVWKLKKKFCNEIDAHTHENDWIAELEAMKVRVKAGDTMPQAGWEEATKKMFDKLVDLEAGPQGMALKDLCAALKKNKSGNDAALAKYEAKKDACDDFLAADISTPENKNKALAALTKAFDAADKPATGTGGANPNGVKEPKKIILGDGESGIVDQIFDPNTTVPLNTGLFGVRDIELRNNDQVLLIAGITFSGGGAVQGYFDFNGDEVFAQSELVGSVQGTNLRGVRDIFLDDAGRVLVYDRGFGPFTDPNDVDPLNPFYAEKVMMLQDFNFDGIPDGFGPLMYQAPSLQHFADTFTFNGEGPSGPRIFGFDDAKTFAPGFSFDEQVVVLTDPTFDGFFDPGSEPFDGIVIYAPTWGGSPDVGANTLELHGKDGHLAEIRVLDDNAVPIEIVGLSLMSVNPVIVPLTRSLIAGETLQIVDLNLNMGSVRLKIPCPGDIDGDNDADLTDLAIQLSNFGTFSGALLEDGDLTGDGDVDIQDLAIMLSVFGTSC